MFAIGVGNYNLDELTAVASEPVCSHVLTLTSFDYIESIVTEIQKSTCEGESGKRLLDYTPLVSVTGGSLKFG